jgi:predicted GNAT superfamily acetyltransferase
VNFTIRPLRALSEMHAAVELQKTYWGNDLESVVPAHMLFSLASYGGHVLAVFDGAYMVGVLIGFLGVDPDDNRPLADRLQIASKRMVILPEYRSQGLGYRLKLAQRDLALKQGIPLVTWTFDPLLAPNAHLNLRKLGAICRRFYENYYGENGFGGLAALGASDRLYVEWWVAQRRVEERLQEQPPPGLRHYLDAQVPILNPTVMTPDGQPQPPDQPQAATGLQALLEIPLDYPALMRQQPALAQTWRLHLRALLRQLIQDGYIVSDFMRDQYEGRDRGFYLLTRPEFDLAFYSFS